MAGNATRLAGGAAAGPSRGLSRRRAVSQTQAAASALVHGGRKMVERSPIIERAFDLARSGECRELLELGLRLKREGYLLVDDHLSGTMLRRQLRELMARAAATSEDAP